MIRLNNQLHMVDLINLDAVYVIHVVHHHEQTVDHVDLHCKKKKIENVKLIKCFCIFI